MNVYHNFLELIDYQWPIHWAAGFFDGVHVGHKRVILSADTTGAKRGVITFCPHPLALLKPDSAPPLLTPYPQQKHALLQELGVDVLLELPFTRELAAMSATDFLDSLCNSCQVAGISVGSNWHFGKAGAGNADFLRAEANRRGFIACVSDMLTCGDDVVCSTRIRALLKDGNTTLAAQMLGRPFSVFGTVEHGQKLARQLGFPTANIALPASAALPRHGVYAVSATIYGHTYSGIANLGMRPTISESVKIPRLEAHFPDYTGPDFYGEHVEVFLHRFIRDERRFANADELKAQIAADVACHKTVVATV